MPVLVSRYAIKRHAFVETDVIRDGRGQFADEPGSGGGAFKEKLGRARPTGKTVKLSATPEGKDLLADIKAVYEGQFGAFRTKVSVASARIGMHAPTPGAEPTLTIWVDGKVVKDGKAVGKFTRQLHPDLGVFHNDQLVLDAEVTGQRFGDEFYPHTGRALARLGMSEERLEPNVDVGGYAQARRGADWRQDDPKVWKASARTIANRIETFLEGWYDPAGDESEKPPYSAADLTPEDRAQLDAWERAFRAGDMAGVPSAPDLAAFGEGRYDWTATTATGRPFPTWPGKQILLGSDWAGFKRWAEQAGKAFDPQAYMVRLRAAYDEGERTFTPDSVGKPTPAESDFNLHHVDLFLPPG